MGFYQVCPGTDEYVLGAPLFRKATLHFENGNDWVLSAPENSEANRYIDQMLVNGRVYTANFLKHGEMLKGGKEEFRMSAYPNLQRGIQEADLPYSFSVDGV